MNNGEFRVKYVNYEHMCMNNVGSESKKGIDFVEPSQFLHQFVD